MNPNTLRFVVAALTGLLIKYAHPPGSGGRGGGAALDLWGMPRHDWGRIHWWIAVRLFGVALGMADRIRARTCSSGRRHTLEPRKAWKTS